jgi:hypothetical protein
MLALEWRVNGGMDGLHVCSCGGEKITKNESSDKLTSSLKIKVEPESRYMDFILLPPPNRYHSSLLEREAINMPIILWLSLVQKFQTFFNKS